jgi:hypothetical protein
MASVDTRATARLPEEVAPAPRPPGTGASLGVVIALSVLLAIGPLLVVAPLVWHLLPTTELPAPFPNHHQDAETLIYVLAFALFVPLGIVIAGRCSDRIAAGPNAASLSGVVGVLSGGLALAVVFTSVSDELPWGGGPAVLAAAAGLWCVLAAVTLRRAASPRPWAGATTIDRRAGWTWGIAGLLLVPVVLSFTHLESISVPVLVVGGSAVAAVVALSERVPLPRPPGWLGRTIDVGLIVLLLLAVPSLVVTTAGDPAVPFDQAIIQFHQNFFLGPANQVLAGDAMLVDVLSQYGVGSIYFLAGAFTVLPISNAMLGVVEGGLSALMFVGTFLTLRIAGVSRLLAAAAMTVAVIALVYGLQYPIGALLQHGAIRFGLPIGVVVGAVTEARWARLATPARLFQLATVAVASVWALEAFAYTVLTVAAIAAFHVATSAAEARRREAVRWVVQVVAACLVAHLVLAGATLAATGELPDWGWYVNTLRAFLFGELGDWTYDFSRFSPGLAVGGLYMASASAVALSVRRRPDLVARHRTTFVAITGMTAYGVALLSYIVNRSADHIIPYVCLPAVALGALWLALAGRPDVGVPALGRRAALATALAVSALLVAVAWSSVDLRFSQSALAYALPGGTPLGTAVDRVRDPAPLRPEAPEAEQLLLEHMPGEERSIVLTSADLSVEVLMRAERGNAVPLGDPWEDSFVPDHHLAPLGAFVDTLEVGDRVLLDAPARQAFDAYRVDPSLDPLRENGSEAIVPANLAGLQEWVLREIGTRFDLRTVVRTEDGLEVVELVPLSSEG